MELLNENEVKQIIKKIYFCDVISWSINQFTEELIGYLGEHLKLIVEIKSGTERKTVKFFVKCLPRADPWKAQYIKDMTFFRKEYTMLSQVFVNFGQGTHKWHPNALLVREDLFVLEDVTELGYVMPKARDIFKWEEIQACVVTLAHFHAQSFVYEENTSRALKRPYRIWDDFSDNLQEPMKNLNWRNAGRNAIIEFIKVHSKYKSNPKVLNELESVVTVLFEQALKLMQPSLKYRNTVVHRDLWAYNIFFKENNDGTLHALFVDFQTVIYSSPMLDLSSLIYFNTSRIFRESYIQNILDLYYCTLCKTFSASGIDCNDIITRSSLQECYEESMTFALTQATLIVPIITVKSPMKEEIFCNPKTAFKINEVSRSAEFIDIARQDEYYRNRVTELCDEIVERYIIF